ncbi:MAG TPA: glycosyltransferase family 2 protein [Bryobacteraceae bacterium]|nr:glycosyltransferase family 2 protein [Bryobacteraceae bacterium]
MARVAIVVVTYQSSAFVGECLDSVLQMPDAEIVVVDNASSDSTCVRVEERHVRLIANAENRGFAAAVNQGVAATSAPLILLLNPDARLETSLEPLIARFDDAQTGAAGGLLVGEDGKPQTGFMVRNLPSAAALSFEALGINRIWPGNPVNWHYRCLQIHPMISALADQPAGAFLMFRREAWLRVGGFDDNFWPVWFEDVDFCARLKRAGYRIWYEPAARAKHAGGHSVQEIPLHEKEKYWYGSLLKYASKNFHPIGFAGVCLSVMIGAAARVLRAFPRGGFQVFAVYGKVIRFSFGHLSKAGAHLRRAGRSGGRSC